MSSTCIGKQRQPVFEGAMEAIGQAKPMVDRFLQECVGHLRRKDSPLYREQQNPDQSQHRDLHHPCDGSPLLFVYQQRQSLCAGERQGLRLARVEQRAQFTE